MIAIICDKKRANNHDTFYNMFQVSMWQFKMIFVFGLRTLILTQLSYTINKSKKNNQHDQKLLMQIMKINMPHLSHIIPKKKKNIRSQWNRIVIENEWMHDYDKYVNPFEYLHYLII